MSRKSPNILLQPEAQRCAAAFAAAELQVARCVRKALVGALFLGIIWANPRANASEEIGRVRVVAPRSLAGARVFVNGDDHGELTFQKRTGPSRVSLVLELPPETECDVRIEKVGFLPVKRRIRSPAHGITRLKVYPSEVRRASAT